MICPSPALCPDGASRAVTAWGFSRGTGSDKVTIVSRSALAISFRAACRSVHQVAAARHSTIKASTAMARAQTRDQLSLPRVRGGSPGGGVRSAIVAGRLASAGEASICVVTPPSKVSRGPPMGGKGNGTESVSVPMMMRPSLSGSAVSTWKSDGMVSSGSRAASRRVSRSSGRLSCPSWER